MRRIYLWATLLLSFGLCGLSLTSCSDNDDDALTDVTVPNNENDGIIDVNGHKAVDLGLSVKWATCNVGANSPEEYGGYYAWGETEEKDIYDWSTYKYCDGSENSMTKYCTDSDYGTVDNKTVLEPEDDVAHVEWGGSWRMPTVSEMDELINNCTWTWTSQDGVNGYVVTSTSNGNSIFLPAAGLRMLDFYAGPAGRYWSASLQENYSPDAYYFTIGNGYKALAGFFRYFGYSVRPVTE